MVRRRSLGAISRRAIATLRRFASGESRVIAPLERVAWVDETMRQYIKAHPSDTHAAKSYPYDVVRLARSVEWIESLCQENSRVLELGGYGIASYVIERRFPKNTYVRTGTDLREALPYSNSEFDIVLNMEVIEHIGDIVYGHATTLSGVSHCLGECRRVLKVGGYMFMSTPNACSLLVLERAMRGEPPWQYPFHFREFTPTELCILTERAGLFVRRVETQYVWSNVDQYESLLSWLKTAGFVTSDRGDDIFLMAQKTEAVPAPRGELDLPI